MGPRTPPREAFTTRERRTIDTLRTPQQVQRFLRDFPYNWEKTIRTSRGVVESGRAHCLEAVLFAARRPVSSAPINMTRSARTNTRDGFGIREACRCH